MNGFMYYPWSLKSTNECADIYQKGLLPILDLELTGLCSHKSCIYCDSKTGQLQDELNWVEINDLILQAHSKGVRWIFMCGLGEPLDSPHFIDLLSLTHKLDINISFFTNGLGITRDLALELNNKNVCLLLKLDSFNEKVFDKILGKAGKAKRIYEVLDLLCDLGFAHINPDKNYTNFALSIVPTKLNAEEIPELVKFCIENHIFPSIGELEYAGRGKAQFNKLALNSQELNDLRLRIDGLWEGEYCRPVCPSVLFGLHLTPDGYCVVDKATGLSCPWFKLTDPIFTYLGNIRKDTIHNLDVKIRQYRSDNIEGIQSLTPHETVPSIFSGCGGKINEIKTLALQSMNYTPLPAKKLKTT